MCFPMSFGRLFAFLAIPVHVLAGAAWTTSKQDLVDLLTKFREAPVTHADALIQELKGLAGTTVSGAISVAVADQVAQMEAALDTDESSDLEGLRAKVQHFQTIDSKLSQTLESKKTFNDSVATARVQHAKCRDREVPYKQARDTFKSNLDTAIAKTEDKLEIEHAKYRYLKEETPDRIHHDSRDDILDGSNELQEAIESYRSAKREEDTAQAEFNLQEKEFLLQRDACNELQLKLEQAICNLGREWQFACAHYEGEHENQAQNYAALVEHVKGRVADRKQRFTALKRVGCAVKLLKESAASSEFDDCSSEPVQTDQFDVTYSATPPLQSCPAVPHRPCGTGYISSEYAKMPADAPASNCTISCPRDILPRPPTMAPTPVPTPAPTPAPAVVLTVKVTGVDYDELANDTSLKEQFIGSIKTRVAAAAGVAEELVHVVLSKGSVIASATILTESEDEFSKVEINLNKPNVQNELSRNVSTAVKSIPKIETVSTGATDAIDADISSMATLPPTPAPKAPTEAPTLAPTEPTAAPKPAPTFTRAPTAAPTAAPNGGAPTPAPREDELIHLLTKFQEAPATHADALIQHLKGLAGTPIAADIATAAVAYQVAHMLAAVDAAESSDIQALWAMLQHFPAIDDKMLQTIESVKTFNESVTTARVQHVTCREEEIPYKQALDTCKSNLDAAMKKTADKLQIEHARYSYLRDETPDRIRHNTRDDVLAGSNDLTDAIVAYKLAKQDEDTIRTEFNLKNRSLSEKRGICNDMQLKLEQGICNLADEWQTVCRHYEGEYENQKENYEEEVEEVKARVGRRKQQFAALRRVECAVNLLNKTGSAHDASSEFDNCSSLVVPATHLEITYNATPLQNSCPTVSHRPCGIGYTSSEYATLPTDAPASNCTISCPSEAATVAEALIAYPDEVSGQSALRSVGIDAPSSLV